MKIIDVPSSGKCGITVTMPGRYGLVRRAWVSPANPNTGDQLVRRSILASQAHRYRALTTAQQDAWSGAAAQQSTRSRLGQSGPLTGLQLFVRINATLAGMGQDAVDVPPGLPEFPTLAPQGLVITNTGGIVAIKLTCDGDPGENTVVRASASVGSGVRATPQFRVIGTCPAAVAGAADITVLYTAKFGTPLLGSRIFVQAQVMVDGYYGPGRVFSALVPAA